MKTISRKQLLELAAKLRCGKFNFVDRNGKISKHPSYVEIFMSDGNWYKIKFTDFHGDDKFSLMTKSDWTAIGYDTVKMRPLC